MVSKSNPSSRRSILHYDNFSSGSSYGLEDYTRRWNLVFGLGEFADLDTRIFDNASFSVSGIPFRSSVDDGVLDHMKYLATSTETFRVPANGAITVEATVTARTPGIQLGRVVRGTYGPPGSYPNGTPFEADLLETQQASATLHMIDFQSGQLFDWLVSGRRATSLVERLPSIVTNSPTEIGREHMYTQFIREHPITEGPHRYGIRFWRNADGAGADYMLDGTVLDRISRVGVPLDRQGVNYSGRWPALGDGEEIGAKMDTVVIAHGLLSLVDAFPYQHPDAPEASVSIPVSERLFGQGVEAKFENFVVTIDED
jgi:hypothetical protein